MFYFSFSPVTASDTGLGTPQCINTVLFACFGVDKLYKCSPEVVYSTIGANIVVVVF